MLYRAGFATAAAAAALAFAPVTAQAQTCGEIELGAAVSATGIYAANGNNTKNGYEFAVKKINDAGGVKIDGKCYHFKVKYDAVAEDSVEDVAAACGVNGFDLVRWLVPDTAAIGNVPVATPVAGRHDDRAVMAGADQRLASLGR